MEQTQEQKMGAVRSFTDLIVWSEAHNLVLRTYLASKKFPREELFCLTSQMRRAAISVTSNIAEGFGRRGKREKVQFYLIAKGSLTELESQFLVARDLKYITAKEIEDIFSQITSVHRLLNAFIRKTNEL